MRSQFKQAQLLPVRVRGIGALAMCLGFMVSVTSQRAAAQEPSVPEQPEAACAQAFEHAQRLHNDSQYLAANQELLKCTNPRCGDALFQECSKLYTEFQAAAPSVVFEARSADRELADVTVTVDGQTLTERLDGKPILVDPGSHTFSFDAAGMVSKDAAVVIKAGEKYRRIAVTLEPKAAAPAAAVVPAPRAVSVLPALRTPAARSVPVASYVLGGVGVLALGGFIAFRASASSEYDRLRSSCAPNCSSSAIDPITQKYTISSVALGVSAAAFVGALVLYVAQPHPASGSETALLVSPTHNGLVAGAVTRF